MSDSPYRVLLVEPDPEIMEMLVAALVRRFDAHVTCVTTADECLDVEMLDPHDLVVAELDLPGGNGVDLAEELTALGPRPVVLLADAPTRSELLRALRAGVHNLFPKPFRMGRFLDATGAILANYRDYRRQEVRYRQLRRLVRHVLRDRRTLNQRAELICQDLVGAHRRLVDRVIELDARTSEPPTPHSAPSV